jgi:DNA-binding transcriptional ArsR family regulator/precorrin-6B methylase 2
LNLATSFTSAVDALRAAGEPTRLRILALLARAELTVGEICLVLGQSQPRVSRHLKVLAAAGLLDRFREEHWVYYRVPIDATASETVRQLLSLASQSDAIFVRDRERMAVVITERAREVSDRTLQAASKPPEWIHSLVSQELGEQPIGALLDVGTGSGHLLEALAPQATRAVGVDISSDALKVARTNVHSAGLSHCELHKGSIYDLPFAANTFDTATIDRLLASAERPLAALAELARAMKPSGRVLIIEDFDALQDASHANPIMTLRQWLTAAGFSCKRIHPLDTESKHLLVAVAERMAVASAAA